MILNTTTTTRVNLLGLTRSGLEAFVAELGQKPFRARQLMKWIYKHGIADFDRMTDLARDFRALLEERAEVRPPEIVTTQVSADGTRKWMLRAPGLQAGNGVDAAPARDQAIEMVFIPEPGRGTLCISSQVGCALDCSFCSTGQQGFNRNLDVAEIVGQVWLANLELARAAASRGTDGFVPLEERIVTNVVFMGMGEPLANYRNVVPAMELMLDDLGFELSRRRVTLSTSGLAPQILKLADECNVALAVSLHAPNDELRNQLVPINRKHPISELLDACWVYLEKQNGRSITFEYVMLEGVNDSEGHARELIELLRGREAKVNLIPFNPFPGTRYRRSKPEVISRFRDLLNGNGIIATTRRTRGEDIDAACGQLVGRVHDRTTVRLGTKLIGVTAEGRTTA